MLLAHWLLHIFLFLQSLFLSILIPPPLHPPSSPVLPPPLLLLLLLPSSSFSRCLTCGNYVYKGKKFNARKEDAAGEYYLGIQIYRFYIRCPECLSEITFKVRESGSYFGVDHFVQTLDLHLQHAMLKNTPYTSCSSLFHLTSYFRCRETPVRIKTIYTDYSNYEEIAIKLSRTCTHLK